MIRDHRGVELLAVTAHLTCPSRPSPVRTRRVRGRSSALARSGLSAPHAPILLPSLPLSVRTPRTCLSRSLSRSTLPVPSSSLVPFLTRTATLAPVLAGRLRLRLANDFPTGLTAESPQGHRVRVLSWLRHVQSLFLRCFRLFLPLEFLEALLPRIALRFDHVREPFVGADRELVVTHLTTGAVERLIERPRFDDEFLVGRVGEQFLLSGVPPHLDVLVLGAEGLHCLPRLLTLLRRTQLGVNPIQRLLAKQFLQFLERFLSCHSVLSSALQLTGNPKRCQPLGVFG